MNSTSLTAAVCSLSGMVPLAAGQVASFTLLSPSTASPHAISGDGSTAVGGTHSGSGLPGRWVGGGAYQTWSAGYSDALAVSSDGNAWLAFAPLGAGIVRWTTTGSLLIQPPPGQFLGEHWPNLAISGDGQRIAANPYANWWEPRASHWTAAAGWTELVQPAGALSSVATGISRAGDVTVGYATYAQDISHAVRWLYRNPQDLGVAPGFQESLAEAVSGDGRVVVGSVWGPGPSRPFVWTQTEGFRVLPIPPGTYGCSGTGASFDGSIVVGACTNAGFGQRPFVWTSVDGTREPVHIFTHYGLNAGLSAGGPDIAISDSGLQFAGANGTGWYARLPPGALCFANCDRSTTPPFLSVSDLSCFLTLFRTGDPYANCDNSTTPPTLNVADFVCFLNRFAGGCS